MLPSRRYPYLRLELSIFLFLAMLCKCSLSCSTFAATPNATVSGESLVTHSNDGDGDTAGNLWKVPTMDWPSNSTRTLSNGFQIPQVPHTFAHFTEGYGIMNEHQVALGESTCTGRFGGTSAQQLNIVDLGKIGLERASTALEAIQIMGTLSTTYGYYDAGESLLVSDPNVVYIFHILPDNSGKSAIWVAQRVPDGHIAAVMNAFTIRDVPLNDPSYLFSTNLPSIAQTLGWDPTAGILIDFTKLFSGVNEGTCKYASGRRMWSVYQTFSPSLHLSPFYDDYTMSAPYPATIQPDFKLNVTLCIQMMRDTFDNTLFSLSNPKSLASGAFFTSSRWATPQTTKTGDVVCWERSISTYKSIVSFIAQSRRYVPREIGGTVWFSPHSSRAGCYTPFVVGQTSVPSGYSNNTMTHLDRGHSAFWAFKYLFNVVEVKAKYMIADVRQVQEAREGASLVLQQSLDTK